MKRHVFAVTAFAALISGAAVAQSVVISPEQETVIREYVTTHEVAPAEISDFEVNVGVVLPETVELHRVEAPEATYSYVVVDNQTLVVEPETRKVIHIIR